MSESSLFTCAIESKPIDFDWSAGYGETWETILPDVDSWTLEQCREFLADQGYDSPVGVDVWKMSRDQLAELLDSAAIQVFSSESRAELLDAVVANMEDETIDGLQEWRDACQSAIDDNPDFAAPMMNYYYPLPNYNGDAQADQVKVMKSGACVLASVDGKTVLALAGGGMDLSWDICQAYIAIGYYPPAHFCELPEMASRGKSADDKAMIAVCIESLTIRRNWAQRALGRMQARYAP